MSAETKFIRAALVRQGDTMIYGRDREERVVLETWEHKRSGRRIFMLEGMSMGITRDPDEEVEIIDLSTDVGDSYKDLNQGYGI